MADPSETPAPDRPDESEIAVGDSVRVYPGTNRERLGVAVEDFGDSAGHGVQIGQQQIVDAARRWAISLGDGSLVFVDGSDLAPA
jgi:hypothetical protein